MAKTLQFRRGTTAELDAITGAEGEIFVDLDKNAVVVMDGSTQGGYTLQSELVSGTNIKTVNGTSLVGSGDVDLTTSLSLNGNSLDYTNIDGTVQSIDLSAYLDDTTNTIVSGVLSGNAITFTREDATTFTVDVSALYDDTNLVTSVNGNTGAITVQETLVSGTNIKTVNGTSLLGSGDLPISGGGGGVALTDFSATTPIVYNNTTGAFSHATSGVNANTYGVGGTGGSSIITIPRITVNNTGHITSVSDENYFPPTTVITGIYVNDQIIQGSSFDPYRPLAIVAGDNVTLSATQSGASGYPELTISSTGGGGASQPWYNAVATTSPDTTLDKPADYDDSTFIADKLVVGGNDPSFTSGAQPSPGSWTSNPGTIGGTIYTSSGDPSASFTVSSDTGGYRWIMTPNNTGFSSGTSSFNNSGSGTTVSYPSNGLPSLPSTAAPASEVYGMVAYDAATGGPGTLTATNCTIHEEVTANNVTYVFWSMTKAQSDNVFNGQAMITSANSASFVTNYFYKNNF